MWKRAASLVCHLAFGVLADACMWRLPSTMTHLMIDRWRQMWRPVWLP